MAKKPVPHNDDFLIVRLEFGPLSRQIALIFRPTDFGHGISAEDTFQAKRFAFHSDCIQLRLSPDQFRRSFSRYVVRLFGKGRKTVLMIGQPGPAMFYAILSMQNQEK